jgi:hypothetical protein
VNGESGLVIFKEVMIAILAVITLSALIWSYDLLLTMKLDNPVTEAQRTALANVEWVATGLFGLFAAFAGYYSGRLPAERAAIASQREAAAMRDVAAEKDATVRRATTLLADAREQMGGSDAVPAEVADHDVAVRIDEFLRERQAV